MVNIKNEMFVFYQQYFNEKRQNYSNVFILNTIKQLLPIQTIVLIDLYYERNKRKH